jgi:hypothetical protein
VFGADEAQCNCKGAFSVAHECVYFHVAALGPFLSAFMAERLPMAPVLRFYLAEGSGLSGPWSRPESAQGTGKRQPQRRHHQKGPPGYAMLRLERWWINTHQTRFSISTPLRFATFALTSIHDSRG